MVQKEEDLCNYDYNSTKPLDKVFIQVTLFQDLCAITHNDRSDKQLCQIAYLIFNRTQAFVGALKKWNAKEPTVKAFEQFEKHMREEHHALKQVGALTIQESNFHQANMIQQVLTQQTEMQDNLQASIDQQVKDSLLNALTEYLTTLEPIQEEVVNNVAIKAKDATSETLLEMMIKLSNKFEELSATKVLSDINPRTGKKYKRY